MRSMLLAALFAWLLGTAALAQQPPAAPPPGAPACGSAAVTPSQDRLYARTMRRLAPADITSQQQTQIGGLIAQFSQTHPAGSPLDRPAMRELRLEINALLTPDQKDALREARRQGRTAASNAASAAAPQGAAAAQCPPTS